MNKAYIVTGASGGLGRLVSMALLQSGAHVMLSGRSGLDDFCRSYPVQVSCFNDDLEKHLGKFIDSLYKFSEKVKNAGIEIHGLFNAIGIPARVDANASNEEASAVIHKSNSVNYEIPKTISDHFCRISPAGTVVFLSSVHSYARTPGKEPYFVPKQKLEVHAYRLARLQGNMSINTLLPGNLGIGMSAPAREKYSSEGSLVDTDIIVQQALELLTAPKFTGKRILVIAKEGKTTVENV